VTVKELDFRKFDYLRNEERGRPRPQSLAVSAGDSSRRAGRPTTAGGTPALLDTMKTCAL